MATATLEQTGVDIQIALAFKELFPREQFTDRDDALNRISLYAKLWKAAQDENPARCPICKRETLYRDSRDHEIGCHNCSYTLKISHAWSKPQALKLWERIQGLHLKHANWVLTGGHHDDKKIIAELLRECLPAVYGDDLSENQIDSISQYLVTNLTNS